MENNVLDILKERGFIAQITHEDELREAFASGPVTFYTGYDPTADSLHVGHFLQAMAMRHLQNAGHKPIVLIGGGTTMIGDPSGRTDMRQIMTQEKIAENGEKFKEQLSRFIDFTDNKAIMENNANWLLNLEYIPFLREIGISFSVNRMLQAECFKSRMEQGLSFLEFNYMIMQAYDFLELNNRYGCILQLGGDDQWSNIIAGSDLIRKKKPGTRAFGMTFNLLTTSEGIKMGKTMAGALWLDKNKTSAYEFYQYWINVDDKDVEKCLSLLTFLPMNEIKKICDVEGAEINKAKKILAYEVTKIVHGEVEANNALEATEALFGKGSDLSNAPTLEISPSDSDKDFLEILLENDIIKSKSEGRRLIEQNGISINDIKITDVSIKVNNLSLNEENNLLKLGKKKIFNIIKK